MNDQAKKLRELAQKIKEEREKAAQLIDPLNTVPERAKLSQNITPKTIERPFHEAIMKSNHDLGNSSTSTESPVRSQSTDPAKHIQVERHVEPSIEQHIDNSLIRNNYVPTGMANGNVYRQAAQQHAQQPVQGPAQQPAIQKNPSVVTPPLIQSPPDVSPSDILLNHHHRGFTTRVIAISSGKGGVGKTNVTANLGIALAVRGKKVMILDADLGMANVDVIFGINPKFNLKHLLDGEKTLQEIIVTGPHSVKIVPGGSGVPELANLSDVQQQKLIDNFIDLERNADITLIDTGAGISKEVISFILAAREALIVTTPEPTAITDAYGLIKVLTQRDLNVDIKVVVNLVSSEKEGREIADRIVMAAKQFLNKKVEPLGYILGDPYVYTSVRQQVPFVLGYPNSKASRCIGNLATAIDRIPDEQIASRNGFRGFLSRLFEK
jgi:flagellar biosynthesis protein FlhG